MRLGGPGAVLTALVLLAPVVVCAALAFDAADAVRRVSEAVGPHSREVQSLRGEMARMGLRYFTLVETLAAEQKQDPLDGVWVIGRVTGASRVVRKNVYRAVAFSPRHQSTTLTLIATDTGVASNMDAFYDAESGSLVAIGGGSDAHEFGQGTPAYSAVKQRNFTLAPVEHLPLLSSWQRVLSGAWLQRTPDWAALAEGWGAHPPGCVDEHAAPACNMDGRFSVVKFRGQWLVYARANRLPSGGRTVQVARSRGGSIRGPYGRFELLRWQRFELLQQGAPGGAHAADGGREKRAGREKARGGGRYQNVYFAAVSPHPHEPDLLVGLFPVNTGEPGTPNGNGGGNISLALSCDGVSWTRLVPLLWMGGREGRTNDHPVHGLTTDQHGRLLFYVQHDVPHISQLAQQNGHMREYALQPDILASLAEEARAGAAGAPALPPPGPAPRPMPLRAPAGGGVAAWALCSLAELPCRACQLWRSLRAECAAPTEGLQVGGRWATFCGCNGCCANGEMALSHVLRLSCSAEAAAVRAQLAQSFLAREQLIRLDPPSDPPSDPPGADPRGAAAGASAAGIGSRPPEGGALIALGVALAAALLLAVRAFSRATLWLQRRAQQRLSAGRQLAAFSGGSRRRPALDEHEDGVDESFNLLTPAAALQQGVVPKLASSTAS